MLQEVHGTEESFRLAIRFLTTKYHVWFSPGVRGGIGGIAILANSFWMETNRARISSEAFVRGRVSRSVINFPNFELVLWNAHNMDLNVSELSTISRALASDRRLTSHEPMRHLTVAGGDLNFQTPGESKLYVSKPAAVFLPPGHELDAADRRWHKMLGHFIELQQPMFTHYHESTRVLSTIDRVWIDAPAWLTINASIASRIAGKPGKMFAR